MSVLETSDPPVVFDAKTNTPYVLIRKDDPLMDAYGVCVSRTRRQRRGTAAKAD